MTNYAVRVRTSGGWQDLALTGPQGPAGPAGPAGVQGVAGPTGPQGAAGTGINLKGQVATVGDLPPTGNVEGDAYVVTATSDLWVWDAETTAWINAGPIQGPPGPTGATGAQGPIGPTGPAGATGAAGTPGAQGIQGAKGDKGDTGTQGIPGTTGATGSQGPQGIQGPVGPAGSTVASGVSFAPAGNIAATNVQAAIAELDNEKVPYSGGTMTGPLLSADSAGINIAGNANTFEVRGTGNVGMSFHRYGGVPFACNFGLGVDNNLHFGGWSYGSNIYQLWTTKDFNYTPVNKAGDTMTGSLTVTGTVAASGNAYCNSWGAVGAGGSTKTLYFGNPSDGHYIDYDAGNNFSIRGPDAVPWYLQANAVVKNGKGTQCRPGFSAGYGANSFNMHWTGAMNLYVDDTHLGTINMTSDYRVKKDVIDLPGMWDTVKALRPIKYTQAQFSPPSHVAFVEEQRALATKTEGDVEAPAIPGHMFEADEIERWGFIAHELQATLVPSAATAEKDAPDAIQNPNPWTVISALTKALQEAMVRIEALEATR